MNKYEKAFNHLREHASFDTVDEMIDIKELVNKATPKKVVYKKGSDGERWFFCSRCNEIVPRTSNFNQHTYPYCPYCGGKFDWGEYFDVD